MKKFFTFMLALVAAVAVNAESKKVTFNFSDATAYGYTNPTAGQSTQIDNGGTLTKDDVVITIAFSSGNGFRFFGAQNTGVVNLRGYVGSSFTIAAPTGYKLFAVSAAGTNLTSTYLSEGMTSGEWSSAAGVESLTTKVIKSTVQFNTLEVTIAPDGETPPAETYDTLTVAKAIEEAEKLADNASSAKKVVVEGYVVNAEKFSLTYNNQMFFLVDDPAAPDSVFEAYGAYPKVDGKDFPAVDGDKVYAFGLLKKYINAKNGNKKQLEIVNPEVTFIDTVPGQNRTIKADTISVDSALAIGAKLADKAVTAEEYTIQGYVSHIYSFFSEDFKNETFWISDDPTSTTTEKAFEVYRGKPADGKEIGWGAKVIVKCKIKNYGGTIENDGNNINVTVVEASTFVPDTIAVEDAVEIANALAEGVKAPKYSVVKAFIHEAPLPYNYKEGNSYKNTIFTVSQFPNEAEGAIAIYKANILKADTAKLVANSYALIKGYVMKKNSGAQIAEGADVQFVEAPDMDTIHCTVAEAVAAGLKLPLDGKSERIYAVTGFVTIVDTEFAEGIETFYMADNAEDIENISFYALEAKLSEAAKAGDKVELVGRLHRFEEEWVSIDGGAARIIAAQGIENVVLTEKVQKVVVDGAIYIVRDGKMFDIRGTQVR